MVGELAGPSCRLCRAPLMQSNARAFKLGSVMFFTCDRCAPMVTATTAAAGEGIRRHVVPAVRQWLKDYPVLEAALEGYERSRHQEP